MQSKHIDQKPINDILENLLNASIDIDQAVSDIYTHLQEDHQIKVSIYLKEIVCDLMHLKMEDLHMNTPLIDYGMDSIGLMDLYRNIQTHFTTLDISAFKECKTLGDVVLIINDQVDSDTLKKVRFKNETAVNQAVKSSLIKFDTEAVEQISLNENEIDIQRQKVLSQLARLSNRELNQRKLVAEDVDIPEFETFDIKIDKRNCIWIVFKTKTIGDQALTDIINVESFVRQHIIDPEKIPILYFTHYGSHFLLGGDRMFLADSIVNEKEKLVDWFERYKMFSNSASTARDPLRIAICSGTAQGGGFEFLLSCDFQFVLPNVKVGVPEIKSSLYAGMGGLSYLANQIGLARAKLMNITGALIYAHDAYKMGLISHITLDPFHDAYHFYETIPDIKIAKHINYRLNQQYKALKNRDLEDWFQLIQAFLPQGYDHIVEDYKMFNS